MTVNIEIWNDGNSEAGLPRKSVEPQYSAASDDRPTDFFSSNKPRTKPDDLRKATACNNNRYESAFTLPHTPNDRPPRASLDLANSSASYATGSPTCSLATRKASSATTVTPGLEADEQLAVSPLNIATGHESNTQGKKKRKRASVTPRRTLTSDANSVYGGSAKAATQGSSKKMGVTPLYRNIYVLSCQRVHPAVHPPIASFDSPKEWEKAGREFHAHGLEPIFDLTAYMEDGTDGTAFVILKEVECSENVVIAARRNRIISKTSVLYLKSAALKKAFPEVAQCHFNDQFKRTYMMAPPGYEPPPSEISALHVLDPENLFIFHHLRLLADYAESNIQAKLDIHVLLEKYINSRYGNAFQSAGSLFAQKQVSQEFIEYLFRPNDFIYSELAGQPAVFVLQEWPKRTENGTQLICWFYQMGGSVMVRRQHVLFVPPIYETTEIVRLNAYPLSYASADIKDRLRARGRKQWEYRNINVISYTGWDADNRREYAGDRFIIDPETSYSIHTEATNFNRTTVIHSFDPMPACINKDQEPPEDAFLAMAADIYGYHLDNKQWIRLLVDNINEVIWDQFNIISNKLHLCEKIIRKLETLLIACATPNSSIQGRQGGTIRHKSYNPVVLLEGPSGTGKTLTAQIVAEQLERPLVRCSCSELGIDLDGLRRELGTRLKLAERWNCVLLFEDAHLFLNEPCSDGLLWSHLSAVFRQVVSRHPGIVFLESCHRVSLEEDVLPFAKCWLRYEDLNRDAQLRIWEEQLGLFDRHDKAASRIKTMLRTGGVARSLNGKQICDTVDRAGRLALAEGHPLDWKHIKCALALEDLNNVAEDTYSDQEF